MTKVLLLIYTNTFSLIIVKKIVKFLSIPSNFFKKYYYILKYILMLYALFFMFVSYIFAVFLDLKINFYKGRK